MWELILDPELCEILTHNSQEQKSCSKSTDFGFFFIDIVSNPGFQGYQVAENRELLPPPRERYWYHTFQQIKVRDPSELCRKIVNNSGRLQSIFDKFAK